MQRSEQGMKRPYAKRSKLRGMIKSEVIAGAGRFLRENEWFWAFAFLALLGLLFSKQFRLQPPPSLPLGSVAPSDIRVPFNLDISDEIATGRKRMEAMDRVPPVYDWDTAMASSTCKSVSAFFEESRKKAGEYQEFLKSSALDPAGRRESEERFLERLSESLGGGVSRFGLKQFYRDGFSVGLESTINSLLSQVLSKKIVQSDERFQGRDQIKIRDIRKTEAGRQGATAEWEVKNPSTTDIITVQAALSMVGPLIESNAQIPHLMRGAIEEFARLMIVPTLTFSSQETAKRREQAAAQVAPLAMHLKKGQPILEAGQVVDEDALQQIRAFQSGAKSLVNIPLISALLVFLLLLLLFSFMYLKTYRKEHCPELNLFVVFLQVGGLMALACYVLQWFLASLVGGPGSPIPISQENLLFLLPVASGAMLLTLLVDKHISVIFSIFFSVLLGILMDLNFPVMLYTLLTSFTAIYGAGKMTQRTSYWRASILLGVVSACLVPCIQASAPGITPRPIAELLTPAAMAFAGGFIVTPVLALPLLPLFEGVYGILTEMRLVALSNMNHPLLRAMSVQAPGTYTHSLMMATISEAGASAIGANALFCRVSCYFHDSGKMLNPSFFVENQAPGNNPHDRLIPKESARIVSAHIPEGMAMCRQYGIPEGVIDIIPQHHGTRRISFFYDKALTMCDPEKSHLDENDFKYKGPKPQTREAAIIMIADGVEAGSRVLKDPSPQKLRGLIREITDRVIDEEQLSQCDLTFEDLAKVQEAFFNLLTGMYARRVSYPSFKFDKEDADGMQGSVPPVQP